MNLYKYHTNSKQLLWYKEAYELVPDMFWNGSNKKYTPEQIKAIAKNPRYAYAKYVIGDRWPETEPYIMKYQNGYISMQNMSLKTDGQRQNQLL